MRHSRIRKLLCVEWDTLAGVAAAALAMVLSFFDLVSPTTVRAILLLIVALILLRELRRDSRETRYAEHLDVMRQDMRSLLDKNGGAGIFLISPAALLHEFQDFAAHLHGEVTWYNACCGMFCRAEAFQATLGQLMVNPEIDAIHLLCDHREQPLWENDVAAHVRQHALAEKVRVPLWGDLSASLSFLVGSRRGDNRPQALIAIIEEPFASRGRFLRVPRYLLKVHDGSSLLADIKEVIRTTTTEFEQAGKRQVQRDGMVRLDQDRGPGEAETNGVRLPRQPSGMLDAQQ